MRVGILAAGGPFPRQIAEAAAATGHDVFVVCIKDLCDPAEFAGFESCVERLGAGGSILRWLRAREVGDLVLAGKARRPSLLNLWPDAWTAQALAKIGPSAFSGDDKLLKATLRLLAEEGFRVIAPETFLANSMAEPGLAIGPTPDEVAWQDIRRGAAILGALSPHDVGQAVVVQQGLVLGIEAVEGTDALLERAGLLAREGLGGVLIKLSKAGQEMRVDAPVVGPTTIASSVAAGLRGIAVEAGRTLVADRPAFVEAAAQSGLFVIAIEPRSLLAYTPTR